VNYQSSLNQSHAAKYGLDTATFASQHLVKPQSVRKQYAATGSYHGVCPLRLPNRRLLWPLDSIEQIAGAAMPSQVAN
jgi:hypothetical protein